MRLPCILLKTQKIPLAARRTLFKLLQIDGFVNGTNLRETSVWPGMKQPWVLLFATNKRPQSRHAIYFLTVPPELTLNRLGQFRIDSESARPVEAVLVFNKPWIWKTLTIGTVLDVEVVEKIKAAGKDSVNDHWKKLVGQSRNGAGYILGGIE